MKVQLEENVCLQTYRNNRNYVKNRVIFKKNINLRGK